MSFDQNESLKFNLPLIVDMQAQPPTLTVDWGRVPISKMSRPEILALGVAVGKVYGIEDADRRAVDELSTDERFGPVTVQILSESIRRSAE